MRAEARQLAAVPRPKLATSFALVVVFFAAATFTAGAGDMISKALDPARCAALMQTTGEDESICAAVEQEEAFQAAQEEAAAAPARGCAGGGTRRGAARRVADGRRGSSGCGDGRHDCGNRER